MTTPLALDNPSGPLRSLGGECVHDPFLLFFPTNGAQSGGVNRRKLFLSPCATGRRHRAEPPSKPLTSPRLSIFVRKCTRCTGHTMTHSAGEHDAGESIAYEWQPQISGTRLCNEIEKAEGGASWYSEGARCEVTFGGPSSGVFRRFRSPLPASRTWLDGICGPIGGV